MESKVQFLKTYLNAKWKLSDKFSWDHIISFPAFLLDRLILLDQLLKWDVQCYVAPLRKIYEIMRREDYFNILQNLLPHFLLVEFSTHGSGILYLLMGKQILTQVCCKTISYSIKNNNCGILWKIALNLHGKKY